MISIVRPWQVETQSEPMRKIASATQEDAAVAVDVGDAAHERHGDDVAEDVAVDDPGGAVELVDGDVDAVEDRLQEGDDDRLVEGAEEDGEADGDEEPVRRERPRIRRGRSSAAAAISLSVIIAAARW